MSSIRHFRMAGARQQRSGGSASGWRPTDSLSEGLIDAARRSSQKVRLLSRVAGYATPVALALLLPAVGPNRFLVAGLLVVFVIPLAAALECLAPTRRVDELHTMLDVIVAAGATTLVPAAWFAAFVIATAHIARASGDLETKRTIRLAALAIVLFSVTGWTGQVVHWYLPVAGFVAVLQSNITFRRLASARELEASDRLDELVSAASAVFWEIDTADARFVSVTGDVSNLLGHTADWLVERSIHEVIRERDTLAMLEAVKAGTPGDPVAIVAEIRHDDGRWIPFRHLIRQVDDAPLPLVRGVSFDVAELEEATATVRHQAQHDALTGLRNRTMLDEMLGRLTDRPFHRAEDGFALLLLDLDQFKEVNDTLGHQAGDELLCTVAGRLSHLTRDHDLVARFGGDEFALVLTHGVTATEAADTAERITKALAKPMDVAGLSLSVQASIGIALAPAHGDDSATLLRRADIAMYEAKRTNQPFVMHELSGPEPSLERLTMTTEIAAALDDGQFELWFQPKVDLETNEVVGAEGLIRWRHPTKGVILPGEFLEWVAMAGQYHRMTDHVLAAGVEAAARLATAGHPIEIALNISVLSLLDSTFPDRLRSLLSTHRVTPAQIVLEITESDALGDHSAGLDVLQRLGRLGTGLSIDDFGTGHSSLSRLRHLPVTEVKIDRSFVSSMLDDANDLVIVRSIIGLAADLGLHTVGEGVEDESVAELLHSLGCDQAQGYHFTRALPMADFEEWLTTHASGRQQTAGTGRQG